MRFTFLFLAVCCHHIYHVMTGANSCQDIDTNSCKAMLSSNPGMCNDPTLSTGVCPKLCKNCPLTCYSCERSDPADISGCNVITCSKGEVCLLWSKFDSVESRNVLTMRCGSKSVCSMVKRRDTNSDNQQIIHERSLPGLSCCDIDLCNVPNIKVTQTTPKPPLTTQKTTRRRTTATTTAATTITTKITTATSIATTTPMKGTPTDSHNNIPSKSTCTKDVIFMLGHTCSIETFSKIKFFLTDVVNSLPISDSTTRVGLATFRHFDTGTTHLQLDRGSNRNTVLSSLQGLRSTLAFGTCNYAALTYLRDHQFSGNRPDVDDVIVILSNGNLHHPLTWQHPLAIRHDLIDGLHKQSSNVIVVAYGLAITIQLQHIATDSGHYAYTHWDHDNTSLRRWLTQLICS